MKTACSTERLEQALAGSLTSADETALYQHLDECGECDAEMQRLAGGAAWCREAAALLPDDEIDHVMAARDEWSVADFTVEHLEPADDPNVLGRLSGYDILQVIGRGGMGVVLKGFDRELKRYVAIKVLAPHLGQSSLARKRFAREAQAAAAVVHPHVLAIHQVQPGGRLPFLVMPLVAGESLAERLKAQGTLDLKEVLRIGMQAAAGLAAAHEQGLVHRDVKPANILLETGVERAVLTDFGLARAADDVAMTRWGTIAGTPEYMSPEQARGEPLDGRSDLFSLGCVLYEMATGVSPFRADSTMATMRRLVEEPPTAMTSLNPELPRWFVGIVTRLLEKDPTRRFASAKEVSDMLESCLAHVQQPHSVPPPQIGPAPTALVESRRRAGYAGLALGALGVAYVLFQFLRPPQFQPPATPAGGDPAGRPALGDPSLPAGTAAALLDASSSMSPVQTAMPWRGRFGEQFDVKVTGQTSGSVWGTDVYTDDSSIPAAAVHAGVIKSGETATVTITIVKSPERYAGTTRNGVASSGWGSYPSGFVVQRKTATGGEETPKAASPTNAVGWRGRPGEQFDVEVTGKADGTTVWGTDVYTDDSPFATAAVHAGVLKAGETGTVTVTVVKPPRNFVGSERNGVRSSDFGEFPSAYVIQRKTVPALTTGVLLPPAAPIIHAPQFIVPSPTGMSGAASGGPDTSSAMQWRGRFGEQFDVKVTGRTDGPVWGTDIYTDDSLIAAAAVHASAIKAGETATVTVTIVKSPAKYTGSDRNGVKSNDYANWPGGYMIHRKADSGGPVGSAAADGPALVPAPATAMQWRERFGERFEVEVTGQTTGSVWGTDEYTDDSLIAAAAVHAGLVKAGERATLTVTIVKSPERHVGSTRNGVTSASWGSYPSSYVLQRKSHASGAAPRSGTSGR